MKDSIKPATVLTLKDEVNYADDAVVSKTLTKNKRIDLLELIAQEYNRLFDQLNNKEIATVTTAVPMTPALEGKVLEKLKSLSTKEISLTKIVDETILGGFILRVGDQQYNASVSNQLNELKSKFQMN